MLIPHDLYGVIGDPIGQSLSPLLHNSAFQALDLPAVFLAWRIPPEALASFVCAVRTLPIAGASVTIPHKEKIIPLLDDLTPLARLVGAVNTLFWQNGKLMGHNTDVEGFLAPLLTRPPFRHALILGAGGAARAVVAGLLQLTGLQSITMTARRPEQAHALAAQYATMSQRAVAEGQSMAQPLNVTVIPWEERHGTLADLVVNTTPMGMISGQGSLSAPHGAKQNAPASPLSYFPAASHGCLAYDLIYQDTPFLQQAHASGWATLNGCDMFAAQGAAQCTLWTGRAMPPHAFSELDKALRVK